MIVENIDNNLYAKFKYDRFRNEKVLGTLITARPTTTTIVAIEDPFPGPKTQYVENQQSKNKYLLRQLQKHQ